jgi:hypothetical protein
MLLSGILLLLSGTLSKTKHSSSSCIVGKISDIFSFSSEDNLKDQPLQGTNNQHFPNLLNPHPRSDRAIQLPSVEIIVQGKGSCDLLAYYQKQTLAQKKQFSYHVFLSTESHQSPKPGALVVSMKLLIKALCEDFMTQAKKEHIQLLIQAQTPTLSLSKPQIYPFVVNVPNKNLSKNIRIISEIVVKDQFIDHVSQFSGELAQQTPCAIVSGFRGATALHLGDRSV